MEKINDSKSVRDCGTGLDPDLSGADSSTVSGRNSQWEFDSATNRGIPSPEAIQATSGKGNKQLVRRIQKKWTQEENWIVMECYYRSKPKINGYRQPMHAIWRDKCMFNITEQRLMDQQSQIRKKQWLTNSELEVIQRRIEDEPHGHVPNDSESEDELWFLGFDKKVEVYF